MSNQNPKKYDLKERTLEFSRYLLQVLTKIPRNPLNQNLISQCIRSGTSIGANYHEADCAESKKDFEHKIGICKKECQETEYWLILLFETEKLPTLKELYNEAEELRKIFVTIAKNSKTNEFLDIRN